MFKVNSFYGWLGTSLFLVAMYLVLDHGDAASGIIRSGSGGLSEIYKTLQGRG